MPAVDTVEAAEGLREGLLKKHRKDLKRADEVWTALVAFAPKLKKDPFLGTQIPKDRFPAAFAGYPNLWKLDLPHAFRAVYAVIGRPGGGVKVVIDWVGSHKEYDRLFGYD